MRERIPLGLAILVATVGVAGCGGGSEQSAETVPPPPELTVPGDTGATIPDTTETTPTETTPSTGTGQSTPGGQTGGQGAPGTGTGGTNNGGTPSGGTQAPDNPQNDTAPAPGSPPDKFEKFCKENPGAC
jgi:hypothetical protein